MKYRRQVPIVTILLIVTNVLCYIYEMNVGVGFTASRYAMYQGAIEAGQYLRVLFSGFMHFDVFHLASNMLCLAVYGFLLERSIHSWQFILIYIVSLLTSGLLVNFLGGNGLHMGASGAIWGLMTSTLVYNLKNGISPYYAFRGIIVNLIYSFSAGVSWQGHIGGGIGGLIVALILFNNRHQQQRIGQYYGY